MALALLGIEIGDYIAIAALISSAFIFYFGYGRTRKSEQIRIARDRLDTLNTCSQKVEDFFYNYISSSHSLGEEDYFVQWLLRVHALCTEIEYFRIMVARKEIQYWHDIEIY